ISLAGSEAAGMRGMMRGILMGRTVETPFRTTVIEDFKLIPSGKDVGEDLESVELGKVQRAVGFFRAQPEGRLNMRQRDLQTFSRLFCETGSVGMLIRTSPRGNPARALFFFWEAGGDQRRDLGFDF